MPGKESCLVLDFVGQHRADFRFDRLFTAITGLSRNRLIEAVEHGFTDLAAGCHIHLQRQTREQVLRSLRTLTQQSWRRLVTEVQSFARLRNVQKVQLGEFLHEQRIELGEVYRGSGRSGWTTLKRDAGLLPGEGSEDEARLSGRLGALLHVDDPIYLQTIREIASSASDRESASVVDRLRAQMLTYQILAERRALGSSALRERLAEHPACAEELAELTDVLVARSRTDPVAIPDAENLPLHLHGAYHIREILTAAGFLTADRYTPFQAGVLALHDHRMELLFVTLDKSAGFHDRISYHDYAVSPTRFHWQTQNTAGPDTPAGQRYLKSPANGWTFLLFVRARKGDPYRACGPVYLAERADITGDRPMSIAWTLRVPLPPRLFSEYSVLRG